MRPTPFKADTEPIQGGRATSVATENNGRSSTAQCSLTQIREVFVNWRQSILSFVDPADKRLVAFVQAVCLSLAELSFLLYVPSSMTVQQKFRFSVRGFVTFQLLTTRYPSMGNCLYLHNIVTHLDHQIWKDAVDLKMSGTDLNESLFALVNQILLRNTNRKDDSALEILFQKIHFRTFYGHVESKHSNSRFSSIYQPSDASSSFSFEYHQSSELEVARFLAGCDQRLSQWPAESRTSIGYEWKRELRTVLFRCGNLR